AVAHAADDAAVATAAATSAAPSTDVSEVVITSSRSASTVQGAIDEKKNSVGVTEVMSAEEIAERPGGDIVNVIEHLPGLSTFADMGLGQAATGEAEYVTIRGIDSSYDAYTINGIRAPSADPDSRALSLKMLPPQGIESVKVYKTPGVDQDGDAIGGIIDFRTPTAFDFNGPLTRITADGNYSEMADKTGAPAWAGGGQLEFARKFTENLGLYFTGYYDSRDSAGESVEVLGYTPTQASEAQNANWASLKGGLSATGVRFDYYNDEIQRYGGNFSLDYQTQTQKLYVQTSFSKYQVTGGDTQHSIIGGVISDYSNGQNFSPTGLLPGSYYQDRNNIEQLVTAKVGGQSDLDRLTLDYSVSYGFASTTQPDMVQGSLYGLPSVTGGAIFNVSNPAKIGITYDSPATQALADNPADDHLWKYQGDDIGSYNTMYTGKFDADYRVDQGILSDVKVGVDVNVSNRVAYDHKFFGDDGGNFAILGPGGVVPSISVFAVGPDVQSLPGRNISFLGGDYAGPFRILDRSTFANGANPFAYTNQFGLNAIGGQVIGNPGAYSINDYNGQTVTGTEGTFAGYLQANLTYEKFLATVGVRYEDVNFASRQWEATGADSGQFVGSSHNYGEVLPSLIMSYRPEDWAVFRGAIRESYTKPAFGLIASPISVSRNDLTGAIDGISEGNPNLKPSTATNYDLSAEFYGPHSSLFTVDLYYKRIYNFIYAALTSGALPPANTASISNEGVAVSQPENGKDADLLGTELDARKQLTELPGPLAGLGVGGSLTEQRSSADSGRADHFGRRTWLPRAPELIYNLDLFYKMYGVNADLAWHYEGLQLVGLDSNNLDEYLQPVSSLDFSVSYPIYGVLFTVAAQNLLDSVQFYKTLGTSTQYLGTQDAGGNGSYVQTGRFITLKASYKW
ncbi:MAG: TonB-dependent receptor, partial [Caulobacteraceae bacterium]